MTTITITPLPDAPFGAMVVGASLASPVAAEDLDVIWRALDDHLLLVFRGQPSVSDDELTAFAESFGPVPRTGLVQGARPGNNQVLVVSNIEEDGNRLGIGDADWLDWHTDYSFRARVSRTGLLEAIELPSHGGGETLFFDMYSLYERLDAELRQLVDSFHGLHAMFGSYVPLTESAYQGEVLVGQGGEAPDGGTSCVHPLYACNPRTGRRAVYANPRNTKQVIGLPAAEGEALLRAIFEPLDDPALVLAHDWQEGDVVLWDQLGLVHARRPFHPGDRRLMRQLVSTFDDAAAPWQPPRPVDGLAVTNI